MPHPPSAPGGPGTAARMSRCPGQALPLPVDSTRHASPPWAHVPSLPVLSGSSPGLQGPRTAYGSPRRASWWPCGRSQPTPGADGGPCFVGARPAQGCDRAGSRLGPEPSGSSRGQSETREKVIRSQKRGQEGRAGRTTVPYSPTPVSEAVCSAVAPSLECSPPQLLPMLSLLASHLNHLPLYPPAPCCTAGPAGLFSQPAPRVFLYCSLFTLCGHTLPMYLLPVLSLEHGIWGTGVVAGSPSHTTAWHKRGAL